MADKYKTGPLPDGGFQANAVQPDYSLTPSGTRMSWAMSSLMQQGYTPQQAAGIVGNWVSESGPHLNPRAKEGQPSTYAEYQPSGTVADLEVPSRKGYGIFQVTDPTRKANFKDFISTLDPELGAFAASLAAASNEINTSYPGFIQAKTIPQSTAYGLTTYENPAPENQTPAKFGQRLGNAMTAFGLAPSFAPNVTKSSVDGWGRDIRGDADYGPPVWDGTWSDTPTLAAPIGAVSTSSLPDITPQSFPSISSDATGFQQGYPSISSDSTGGLTGMQTGGGFGADSVGPYAFSGMMPSAALTSVQNDLASQYANTPPASLSLDASPLNTGWAPKEASAPEPSVSPYGFSNANVGAVGDFGSFNTGSPFGGPLNTAGVNPRIGDANLTGLQANKLGYPDMSLAAPSPLPSAPTIAQPSFAKAPTEDPYGMPPSVSPSIVGEDFSVSLPPEVGAPDFGIAATPTTIAPSVTPRAVSKPVVAPPVAPKPIRAVAPVQTLDQPQAAAQVSATSNAMPDFGAALNSLWSPTAALQNRQAFSGLTGMNMPTLNALTNAYDNGGMLTGVAYSALQNAFNSPVTSGWTSAAPAAGTSAPLPDVGAAMGSWGQQNGITGNWAQDTSNNASNARIANAGSLIDPLTGRDLRDPTASSFGGWGFGGWGGGGFGDTNPGLR